MRELSATKGLALLDGVLDGVVSVGIVGKCQHCGEVGEVDAEYMKDLAESVKLSVDHRLKANEQALKYGLGTKNELSVVSPEVIERLQKQVVLIAGRETWGAAELLEALDAVWN
jgi:hypothetical protein